MDGQMEAGNWVVLSGNGPDETVLGIFGDSDSAEIYREELSLSGSALAIEPFRVKPIMAARPIPSA
jgi:hypothetical protein